jgi:hypothetical protein
MMGKIALAIHGGCGVMAKLGLTEAEWEAACVGWAVLTAKGSALNAAGVMRGGLRGHDMGRTKINERTRPNNLVDHTTN